MPSYLLFLIANLPYCFSNARLFLTEVASGGRVQYLGPIAKRWSWIIADNVSIPKVRLKFYERPRSGGSFL